MTSVADLERQAHWELEGVRVATERYRTAALTADPTTLPPGAKLLRTVVPALAAALRLLQTEGADAINAGGRYGSWCWPIQLLTADKLAIIVATVGFRVAMSEGRAGSSVPAQSRMVCNAIRDQLEFDKWEAEQDEAKREAKRLGKDDFEDLMGRLKRRYPTVDRRVWARWRDKLELIRDAEWSDETVCVLGAALFNLMIQTAPETWRLDKRELGGGQFAYSLRLTEEALEVLKDLTARAEVARPLLMPMLIPPNKWRYQ